MAMMPETIDRDAEQFRRILDDVLATAARQKPSRVVEWSREPSEFAALHPAEVVRARMNDNEQFVLFVKHLGSEEAEHPDKQCRHREAAVYELMLTCPGLPVVRYYGSRYNGSAARLELFLEYVDGSKLKYQALDQWVVAARRLGELHARFACRRSELNRADYLLRLDGDYFLAWFRRAREAVFRLLPSHARSFDVETADYRAQVAGVLASQPSTLVHNDLSAKNVIVGRDSGRICMVDWEMAGVGCGWLDFVRLRYDRLDPDTDSRVLSAYSSALKGSELLPAEPGDVASLLLAAELHTTIYRIAHSDRWGESREHLAQRVQRAIALSGRLRSHRRVRLHRAIP